MIGRTLSHYRVLEQIGAGGMGVVHRARDERLGRDVALKMLPVGALADDAARERFRREALALSRLNHPHIATIYDLDRQDGLDFLVLEYIPGKTVAEKIAAARGPLPEAEAVSIGSQIAEALEEAHEQGIVHGDLSCQNIIVTPKPKQSPALMKQLVAEEIDKIVGFAKHYIENAVVVVSFRD